MSDRFDGRDYQPIACSLHDRLEAAATLGRTVRLVLRGANGEAETLEDRIADVFARDGAEFVRTAGGRVIRLDHLDSLDGVPF